VALRFRPRAQPGVDRAQHRRVRRARGAGRHLAHLRRGLCLPGRPRAGHGRAGPRYAQLEVGEGFATCRRSSCTTAPLLIVVSSLRGHAGPVPGRRRHRGAGRPGAEGGAGATCGSRTSERSSRAVSPWRGRSPRRFSCCGARRDWCRRGRSARPARPSMVTRSRMTISCTALGTSFSGIPSMTASAPTGSPVSDVTAASTASKRLRSRLP
jgi:hypothetical protein